MVDILLTDRLATCEVDNITNQIGPVELQGQVMKLSECWAPDVYQSWLCPDLRRYWRLGVGENSDLVVLHSIEGDRRLQFSGAEGFALRHFTGQFSLQNVQAICQKQFKNRLSSLFVLELLQKLVDLQVLELQEDTIPQQDATATAARSQKTAEDDSTPTLSPMEALREQNPPSQNSPSISPAFKAGVHWIDHPDGYWILSNPVDVTYLQVCDRDKLVIDRIGKQSLDAIAKEHNRSPDELKGLLRLLAATAMFVGTQPPKPPKKKFTPMQLLFFKVPLFNPDPWLNRHIDRLRWLWSRPFGWSLCFLLAASTAFGLNKRADIFLYGRQILENNLGTGVILAFVLLSILVVALHELGHAFTLKHYGGVVPDMGLMFMFLMPIAYTNTTDQYRLPLRSQRALVVGAGVLCQVSIAAIAFWIWNLSAPGSWLGTTGYLLMVASLFTVAINLNPLAKFDGYYLASAVTGINNLRSRSFMFYGHLLRLQLGPERPRDRWMLGAYAPFSFLYILSVFGFLFARVIDWTLTNIPFIALVLLLLWAIYFYMPADPSASPKA